MTTLSTTEDSNKQLDTLQEHRYSVIQALTQSPELIKQDKDLRRDLRGFLKDADSQILTKKRIESDDENTKEDLQLKAAYVAMLQRNGGTLPVSENTEKIINPELPAIDDFNFEIPESELKIGNDIDSD